MDHHADIEDKLTGIVRLIDNQPDQAAHALRVTLRNAGINIADLRVIIASTDRFSSMRQLADENRELRAEVRALKSSQGLTWAAFTEACSHRVDTTSRKWRRLLAAELGVNPRDLAQYEHQNRVPVSLLKQVQAMPDMRDHQAELATRRRSNFIEVAGDLIDHLRMSGATPTEMSDWLNQFGRLYNGHTVELNKVLGRRTVMSAPKTGSDDPLFMREITAMANELWDVDAYKRPMQNFIKAHLQIDVDGYSTNPSLLDKIGPDERSKLRHAVENELMLRHKNARYERFSRAFANLPKRTRKRLSVKDVGSIELTEIRRLITTWFGDDHVECMAALTGWTDQHVADLLADNRPIPKELEMIIAGMKQCLHGIDLDDPNFVDKVFRAVKVYNREG